MKNTFYQIMVDVEMKKFIDENGKLVDYQSDDELFEKKTKEVLDDFYKSHFENKSIVDPMIHFEIGLFIIFFETDDETMCQITDNLHSYEDSDCWVDSIRKVDMGMDNWIETFVEMK